MQFSVKQPFITCRLTYTSAETFIPPCDRLMLGCGVVTLAPHIGFGDRSGEHHALPYLRALLHQPEQ